MQRVVSIGTAAEIIDSLVLDPQLDGEMWYDIKAAGACVQVLCGLAVRRELTYEHCLFILVCCWESVVRCRNYGESVPEFSRRR